MAYTGMGNTDAQYETSEIDKDCPDVSMSDNSSLPDIADLLQHDSYEVQTSVAKHTEQLKRCY